MKDIDAYVVRTGAGFSDGLRDAFVSRDDAIEYIAEQIRESSGRYPEVWRRCVAFAFRTAGPADVPLAVFTFFWNMCTKVPRAQYSVFTRLVTKPEKPWNCEAVISSKRGGIYCRGWK